MSRPWKGGRDPETRGRVSPAKVPVPERAVHTFSVVIESNDPAENTADDIRRALDDAWFVRTTVEHVHSRFPSGMMADPKRDGS